MRVPPGFRQASVSTSLGRMAYYTQAEPFSDRDRPNLVFFHGFGGGSSAYEWSQVYPAFATEYPVFAPDLLGWGNSDHPARDYRVEDYLGTMEEFLEQICPAPAAVIASSLTGAMVIRLAIAHPDRVRCLVLVSPSGLSDFGVDYRRSFFAQLVSLPFLDRLIYGAGVASVAGIRNFLEQRQFAHPERISPELVDAYFTSAQQPNAEYAALAFVRGDLCFDLAEYFPQLAKPTAILWGRQSQFTPPDLGQRLAALNPSAVHSFHIIEDCGLTPQLELPAVTIALVQRVLRQFLGTNENGS